VLTVLNKGQSAAGDATLTLASVKSPDEALVILELTVRVPGLPPGTSTEVTFTLSLTDAVRENLALLATFAAKGMTFQARVDLPFFRNAAAPTDYRVLDGVAVQVWVQGNVQQTQTVGIGNADGVASAGEQVVLGVLDGPAYRLLELFTNDSCVDNRARTTDLWPFIDYYMAHYNLPVVQACCADGHVVPFFARWVKSSPPEHSLLEGLISLPISAPGTNPAGL
jgi:hypothetical protein